MKTKNLTVKCPKCSSEFALESTHLSSQFEESIRKDLSAEILRREQELADQRSEFILLYKEFEKEKQDFSQLIDEKVKGEVKSREEYLRDSIHKQVQEEKEAQLEELENELKRKSEQLKDMNKTKSAMLRLSIEMEEKEAEISLRMESELTKRLSEMKSSLQKQLEMEATLKLQEKQNIIDSLRKKVQEAAQRIDQGSVQMQGESMELTVEQLLKDAHPSDIIQEVKKGQRGMDLHQVIQLKGKKVGSIGYEIKNTKAWSDSFLDKMLEDNLEAKCDQLILVSKTKPKEMNDQMFLLIRDIWVVDIKFVEQLSYLIRFGLLKVHEQRMLQDHGDTKSQMIYDFLTSQECQSLFNSIMDGLKKIEELNDLEEKRLQALFKRRKKHLELLLNNFISYYGTMKGIADDSIQDIPMLEFKQAS